MKIRIAFSVALATIAVTATAQPTVPNNVRTERGRQAPATPTSSSDQLRLSDAPRYFLDTIDSLNRIVTDEFRTAPGLSKNNYVARIFPVYNTEAIHIQSYLLRSVAYEGGIVEVMGAKGVTDSNDRPVQFLYVTAPDFMIPGIEEIVALSDVPGFLFFDGTGADLGSGPGAVAYRGKHRTASELAAILSATELSNIGALLFPPFADDATNTIYVVDNPVEMADNIATLEYFDRPPLQLLLDVTIYELDTTDMGRLGLQWDAWKRGLSGSFAFDNTAPAGQSLFGDGTFTTFLNLDPRFLVDFLNYTVQQGTSEIVTSTKLTMLNSENVASGLTSGQRGPLSAEPAVLQTGTPVIFPVLRSGGPGVVGEIDEVVLNSFEGVRLEMLPFIGEQSVTLRMRLAVNSVTGFSGLNNTPLLSERQLDTMVSVLDGGVLVTGGLDRIEVVESKSGIPYLMDIPVAGALFRVTQERKVTRKVLVSLQARILEGGVGPDAGMLSSVVLPPREAER